MKKKLVTEDDFKRGDDYPAVDSADLDNTLKLIGALDISYSKVDEQKGVAVLVIFDYPSMNIVYENHVTDLDVE